MRHSAYPLLLAECIALMVGLPLAMLFFIPLKVMLPLLWLLALGCWLALPRDTHGSRLNWKWQAVNAANVRPILARFLVCAALITALTLALWPEMFLSFMRSTPRFWLVVMLAYPLLSVVAQEVIFRSYFFERYRTLFGGGTALVLASALAFGFAHIMFQNWVAPLMCAVGGWFFARTYARTGSLALVVLEHALYGDFIFTVGLGRFFYHGAVS